jgi:magnesium transporter
LLAAYLAVVGTALLVPNTIATMLGNSVWNYGPQDLGVYLILIIGTTLIASLIMGFWIYKQGLLPKDTEPIYTQKEALLKAQKEEADREKDTAQKSNA